MSLPLANPNEPHFYVPEIFGPTIQGEGKLVGSLAHFIRFGGCDYECKWCDSLHAVDSSQFKKAPKLSTREILHEVRVLDAKWKPDWVILTGGNPALFPLANLVSGLQNDGHLVAIETQGSQWSDWIRALDLVCISPKPPSAGIGPGHRYYSYDEMVQKRLNEFLGQLLPSQNKFIKVPCLNEQDLEWAFDLVDWLNDSGYGDVEFFLSVVTLPSDNPERLLRRTTELFDSLQKYDWRRYARVRLFPQLHFLLWGHAKGH